MVFNSGFDNSLWLILSSDNKYKFNIAEFIYNMPKELYDSIYNQLKEYNQNEDLIDYDVKCFKKAIINHNGINSYYVVEMTPCEIRISLKRWNSVANKLNEDIEIRLFSLNTDELENMEYPINFGSYKYNSSRFLDPFGLILTSLGDEREYEIYDNDNMMLNISISFDSELDRKVSLRLMPKEMDFKNLSDRRSVNKLVRGRKK